MSSVRWGIGVMAAPRPVQTVQNTVRSLRAGWVEDTDIYVFAEPGSVGTAMAFYHETPTGKQVETPIVHRPDTICPCEFARSVSGCLGNFQNWVQSGRDLLVLCPDADVLLMCEDDAVFNASSRAVLEEHLWPSWNTGCISLYCTSLKRFHSVEPMLRKAIPTQLYGCVAVAFPRSVLRALVNHPSIPTWPGSSGQSQAKPWERKAVDTWVGKTLGEMDRSVYTFSPSLVEHHIPAGLTSNSSMGHGPDVCGRKALNWVGLNQDCRRMFRPHHVCEIEERG